MPTPLAPSWPGNWASTPCWASTTTSGCSGWHSNLDRRWCAWRRSAAGAEQDGGAGREGEVGAGHVPGRRGGREAVLVGGVDDHVVAGRPGLAGQREDGVLLASVQHQEVGLVQQALPAGAALPDAAAVQVHADGPGVRGEPVRMAPSARNQARSLRPSPSGTGRPSKNARCRSTGDARRSATSRRTRPSCVTASGSVPPGPAPSRMGDQSIQDTSLSWQYALLLPPWVRRHSSPASSIGTPVATSRVTSMLRACRPRSAFTAGSLVSPSTPQFQDRLSSVPSRLPSPFASLCLRWYVVRSRSVNPSWQVTKLIEANGRRPSSAYRSEEPVSR